MIQVTQESLLEAMKKLNIEGEIQKETNQIYHVFKLEKREFPLFIRILHDGELLQFLTFMPVQVKKAYASDVARLLHMLNKELDMPGFCLDETSSTVFYRILYPAHKKEMPTEILQAVLNTTQVVCKTFSPAIEAVAHGLMKFDEMLKKAEEAAKSTSPKSVK
jgi:hypothetical protein